MNKNYMVTDIEWDTDGEDIWLPPNVLIEAKDEDDAIDKLSDSFGFCIKRANVEEEQL